MMMELGSLLPHISNRHLRARKRLSRPPVQGYVFGLDLLLILLWAKDWPNNNNGLNDSNGCKDLLSGVLVDSG